MTLFNSSRAILRFLVILMFGGFGSQSAFAQPVAPDAELDYIIEDFVLPGGRLGNNVNCITEGPYGFLWFGSHGGVHRYDGYEFVTYKNDPADTLGENTSLTFPYTEHLFWDSEDKLWISTYGGGLYRFDPVTEILKHFSHDPNDPTSISHPRVMWAQEDAEGRMWFSTDHGICRLDRETETFTRYYPFDGPENIQDNTFRNIYLDKQGILWFSGGNAPWQPNISGLTSYDKSSNSFITYVHDPDDPTSISSSATRAILEDSQGNFWVGNSLGLNKMDRDKGTFEYYGLSENKPYAPGEESGTLAIAFSMIEDHNGNLLVGAMSQTNKPSNLLKYDPKKGTVLNLPLSQSAWYMCQSADGTIWVAGAGINGKVARIKSKSKTYDLSKGGVYEKEFHGERNQINRGDRPLLPEFLSGSGPISLGFDRQTGIMWGTHGASHGIEVGSATAILSAYNPESEDLKFYHLPELNYARDASLAGNSFGVSGIAIDKQRRVWASYPGENIGLFRFDPETREVKQFLHDPEDSTSISSNFIVDIYIDNTNEDIWACTYYAGLNRINTSTGEVTRIDVTNVAIDAGDNFPITTIEDGDGNIWIAGQIGTGKHQFLVKLDPEDNQMEWIPMPEFLPMGAGIMDLDFMPGQNALAFVPHNYGFGYYDYSNGHFDFFNSQGGNLTIDVTRKVLYDFEGNLWASTRDGQFLKHSIDGGIDIINKENRIGSTPRDGDLAPDGKLYFNSRESWDVIDPNSIDQQSTKDSTKMSLVDLYVMGEKVTPGKDEILESPVWMIDEITLEHDVDNFAFRFTDFNFGGFNTVHQYRLFPYEVSWSKIDGHPLATYYKIPSGTYEFQVKSSDVSDANLDEEINLQVIVLPPWWFTWWAYASYFLLFLIGGLWIHRYQKQRTIRIERERTREKELKHAKEIEKAYSELKATQSQLIQSEKMASLGELTAGIAHEIQNPLNFVNNFSEVNSELISDLKEGIKVGNLDEVGELLNDLEQNEQKIAHHGKRADSIVKGMLQHSRTDSGEKVPTDINALCEEYLRIAYHGLRAKDITFNAELKTSFAQLENLEVIPQDISRVLLNIITNAFHAVHQRKNDEAHALENGGKESYQSIVSIETAQQNGSVIITIGDNGGGIPDHIKTKIFQPFFTTKPTGQGTGLGLSLAYDIVKAHGGELRVESEEGKGSKFMIELPLVENTDYKNQSLEEI